jgi:N-acetylneuraminic acid mutarotase
MTKKAVASAAFLVLLTIASLLLATPAFGNTPAENTWVQKAPMQQARGELGVATVNGKIYAIGGTTTEGRWPYTGGIVATNEEYDPATNGWTFKQSMPTPRKNFGIAVYENKIYCIGGEEIYKNESRAPLTNVNEVYDPATDTWETKEPMPTPRSDLRANVVNGKIYLIAGHDPNVHFKPGASTHNEVYDPLTDSWSTKQPITDPIGNYGSAVFGDKIYLMGGYAEVPWPRFDLNQIYDTTNDSWSYGTPLPEDFASAICVVTTGYMAPKQIYVFGEKNVLSYNPNNDTWTSGADIPTGRGGSGVAVVNDFIYVIGGETADGIPFSADPPALKKYATNEQYTPLSYTPLSYVTPDPSLIEPTPTSTPPTDRNPPHLEPIEYLLPIGIILAVVILLSVLLFRKYQKR